MAFLAVDAFRFLCFALAGVVVSSTTAAFLGFCASACDMSKAITFQALSRFLEVREYLVSGVPHIDMVRRCSCGKDKFYHL